MANIFGISTELIMVIFLGFVTITIELGIASTSTSTSFSNNIKKKKTVNKKKNAQITFFNMSA